jgi:hypothetical protein
MKSPEYVFNVTRLYRELLDRGDDIPVQEYEELVRRSELAYSRMRTSGWIHSALGSQLLEPGPAGHRGAFLARVERVQGKQIVLRLAGDLSLHDGLAYVPRGSLDQVAFPVVRIQKEGRETRFAHRGDLVSIDLPRDLARTMPRKGQEIRQLSSRFLDLKEPREGSFPEYKFSLDFLVTLGAGGLLCIQASGFPLFTRQVTVIPSAGKKPFLSILSAVLKESGDSVFQPGTISFENSSGLPDDGVFLRPSELKRVKNELYAFLGAVFPARAHPVAGAPTRAVQPISSPLEPAQLRKLVGRDLISPPGMSPLPFVGGEPRALVLSDLAELAGFHWLPLPPVLLETSPWVVAVQNIARRHRETRLAVGLNNVSHLAFLSALSKESNVWFFSDIYLYAANNRTLRLLRSQTSRFLFAYEWLEEDRNRVTPPSATRPAPVVRPSGDFKPPLFYSLACFTRHSMNKGRCVEGCLKDFQSIYWQGKNRFRVIVRDCVTYVFLS